MANHDRQLFPGTSSQRERWAIVGAVVLLIGGLALVTWNLVDRSEQSVNDVRKVKISSIAEQEARTDASQQHEADQQAQQQCLRFPNILKLTFRGLPLSDEGLKDIGRLKKLEYLNISGTDITDEGLGYISHLPLKELDVDGTQMSDTGMQIISHMSTLERLNISDTSVSTTGVCLLKDFPHLSILKMSGDHVGNAGLQAICRLKRVGHLCLEATDISEQAFPYLLELPELWNSELTRINFTDDGARTLSKLRAVTVLDVAQSNLTENGLNELCKIKTLKELRLGGTNITDKGLGYIEAAPALTQVDFSSCSGLTEASLAKLQAAKPKLQFKLSRSWNETSGEEKLGRYFEINKSRRSNVLN